MFKKLIAMTSLVLPLAVAAAAAQAGSTVTDKSYWPNEARMSRAAAPAQSNPSAAFASETFGPALSVSPRSGNGAWRYQGGPKGR